MKQNMLLILFVFSLSSFAQTQRLQFMSYNVKHCCGNDNITNEQRTAGVINQYTPDIVAIQELDSMNTRTKTYQIKNLGAYTNMHYTYARSIAYRGGSYGIGMLSKEAPISVKRIPLPGQEARVLLVCEFKDYVFACSHLDLVAENRIASIPIILAEAKTWDKPFFIAGDFNDRPTSDFYSQFSHYFNTLTNTELFTHPSEAPNKCIDYIAQYKNTKLTAKTKLLDNCVVDEPMASDHRPILANIVMGKFVTGDVNGDGKVNAGDLTTLASWVMNADASSYALTVGDLSPDKKINAADITAIVELIMK